MPAAAVAYVARRPDTLYPRRRARFAALLQHGVDQAVGGGLLAGHEIVAIGVGLDPVDRLAGVLRQDGVQAVPGVEDLAGVDLDVRRLALEAAERLVDHHARVRQAETLALRPAGQQHRAHARRLADADR